MDKVAVIGYMYELDKELRKRLFDYPFSQIIIEEAMNEAIHRLALCEEYQTCGLCTKELIGLCRFLQPGENYRKLIQSQIQLLLSVENQHKVPGYAELLSALYKRL